MSEIHTADGLKQAVKALEKPIAGRLWKTVIPVVGLVVLLNLVVFLARQSGIPISTLSLGFGMGVLALVVGRYLEGRFHGIQSMLMLYRLEQDLQNTGTTDETSLFDDLRERYQNLTALLDQ